MSDIGFITLALLLALFGAEVAVKFKYPRVIGQLVVSLFLGLPLVINWLGVGETPEVIKTLSELGVIFLLLLTGFELNVKEFTKNGRESLIIAVFAAMVPFVLGLSLAFWFGYGLRTGIVLGACMSVTAEGTKVALLLEMGKIKTRLASIMLGAGILDDIFEIFFLALIIFFAHHQTPGEALSIWPAAGKILFFGLAVYATFQFLPLLMSKLQKERDREIPLLTTMIIVGLVFALLSEFAGTGAILGAFIAGIMLQESLFSEKRREEESKSLKLFVFAFIIPFFFFNIGLHFNFESLIDAPQLTISVVLVAMVGKILGTLLTKPFVNLTWQQLHLVGWGMNSRGVMELVLAQLALESGLIDQDLYSAIVFMAIITTVMFPFVFKRMIGKNPQIMD
ncbi:MAG TPA: cation:proton antiporter [Candidatus Gracilibacteria bacterium]